MKGVKKLLSYILFIVGLQWQSVCALPDAYICEGKHMIKCKNKGCVPASFKCDRENDCGDNSDESDCKDTRNVTIPKKCDNSTHFQCKNEHCIPLSYTCDAVDDCGDQSDESKLDGPLCSSVTCMPSQMKCDNGICLGRIWKCDKIDDCGDGSDERNCSSLCEKGKFRCETSRECIASSLHCNGKKDCQDGSDEQHCNLTTPTSSKMVISCNSNQYKCKSNKKCITHTWLCDGNNDCPDGEDESFSVCNTSTCSPDEFACFNGQCVPKGYKCDGVVDCHDKSDEEDCEIMRELLCSKETHNCKNSTKCIHLLQFCDGIKNCPQGEDEGPKCGINECLVQKGNCSHQCKDLPIGYKCVCPRGYKLSADNVTCIDINECKDFGRCSQRCINHIGWYSCHCDEGFTLEHNKKTCRAGAPTPYLLFANSFDIREVSLSGNDYKPIISIWSSIVALAVDTREKMVYWADNYNKTISCAPMGNPKKVDVIMNKDIKLPKGLDVDWIGRKLYWTDSDLKTISVSNLNGTNRKVLIEGSEREEFRAIVVHPEKKYIFWTNWVTTHSKIERANLDGSNRMTIVSTNIVWVSGLAVDYRLDRVYWSDRFHRHISSSTIHGEDIRKIVTNLHKPTGLTIFEDKVYWIDSDLKKLSHANKFDGYKRMEYKENLVSPIDVVIYHPLAQKEVPSACQTDNGGCSHLCFASSSGQSLTCSCPDHLYLGIDRKTCSKFIFKESKDNKSVLNVGHSEKCIGVNCEPDVKESSIPVEYVRNDNRKGRKEYKLVCIIGGVIGILLFTTIVIAVIVYRKKRNQFDLSIMYETDTDHVVSIGEEKYNTNNESNYLPEIGNHHRAKGVLSFDNVNFKPTKDDMGILNNPDPGVDLVMDDCTMEDDHRPIIAHMV